MLVVQQYFTRDEYENALSYGNSLAKAVAWLYTDDATTQQGDYCLMGRLKFEHFMNLVCEMVREARYCQVPKVIIMENAHSLLCGKDDEIWNVNLEDNVVKNIMATVSGTTEKAPAISYSYMTHEAVECVLWAAYVYCLVFGKLGEKNAEQGQKVLYECMYEFSGYESKEEFRHHPLIVKTKETMVAFLQVMPTQEQTDQAQKSQIPHADGDELRILLEEKEQECEQLRKQVQEYEDRELFRYVSKGKTREERVQITREIRKICTENKLSDIKDRLILKMQNGEIDIVNKEIQARDLFLELGRMGMPILTKGYDFKSFQTHFTAIRNAAMQLHS